MKRVYIKVPVCMSGVKMHYETIFEEECGLV